VQSGSTALKASESFGIGYGRQTTAPGAFYPFPGDPRKNGTGSAVTTTKPA
jgi:hypothetical protein